MPLFLAGGGVKASAGRNDEAARSYPDPPARPSPAGCGLWSLICPPLNPRLTHGGRLTSMPTAGPSWRAAGVFATPPAHGSRGRASPRWNAARSRSPPATKRTCTPSPPTGWRTMDPAPASTCTPRPNSRPRNCSRRARRRSSTTPASTETAKSGPLHAPEFTMLEWYRAGEPYEAVMADCVDLCRLAVRETGRSTLEWRGSLCDPSAEPERLTLIDAFAQHAQIDLEATLEQTRHARRRRERRPAFASLTTIAGPTSSAAFWSGISSRSWDTAS